MCTGELQFLVVILDRDSSVHYQIEICSRYFSPSEQCALSNWNL